MRLCEDAESDFKYTLLTRNGNETHICLAVEQVPANIPHTERLAGIQYARRHTKHSVEQVSQTVNIGGSIGQIAATDIT